MSDGPSLGTHDLSGGAVLCIGDVMLDRFVYGRVERISPEAPIPILQIENETTMPGGAGNVALNLAALGADVRFVSVIGDDETGRALRAHLDEFVRPIRHDLIVEAARETTLKTRFIAGVQQMMRADRETPAPVADETNLTQAIERALDGAGAVVLSDYGKGLLSDGVIQATIKRAAKKNIPVIVDPKGRDFTRYRGATIITPNRSELADATGAVLDDHEAVIAAARHVIKSADIASVLVTLGADGMIHVTKTDATHLAAEARAVFDVSGAGDTVVAALGAGIAAGADEIAAAAMANVAAGIAVGKLGTAVVFEAEVKAAVRHQSAGRAEAKVMERADAVARIQAWRNDGETIGFTNGCFDLLHPGHVSLLSQAKAACDRLVVGLNADASVKRLKGESRPVQDEGARAQVLASLADVDLVVLFAEDTPLELISAIKPDVLVKGADYTVEQVVGADVVHKHGGRVLLADLVDGHSTTETVGRLTSK